MDVIVLTGVQKGDDKRIEKISGVLSMLNKDNINKVYLIYSEKDNEMNNFLGAEKHYKFEIVPIKLDNATNDLGILSKINYVVNEQNIKNDVLIIENGDSNLNFSAVTDYFEATKKPIILLKTIRNKKALKRNEVVLDKNGFVKTVIEHPINPKSKIMSAGVYFIPKDALFWIKKIANTGAKKTSFDVFIKKLAQKRKVRGIIDEGNNEK